MAVAIKRSSSRGNFAPRSFGGKVVDINPLLRRSSSFHSDIVADSGLFDIDLEDGSSWSPTSVVDSTIDLFQLESDITTLDTICSASSVEEDVMIRRVRRILKSEEVSGSTGSAFDHLKSLGFPVEKAFNRQMKKDIFHSPRHEFLKLQIEEDTTIIVDTDFRASFAVARPSYYYSKVFEELPSTYIGNEDRLRLLVSFMSQQLKRNFANSGMSCPPWRDSKSLLNTWAL